MILSTVLCLGAALMLWGCSSQVGLNLPVRTEMQIGDRERDWALVFFQSWRQHRQPTYLNLSRQHMAGAVKTYFDLQVKIGHSYPDFYTLDKRRRSGCRFIDEIDRLAARFRVPISEPGMEGCLTNS
jgi:hypothetical protein